MKVATTPCPCDLRVKDFLRGWNAPTKPSGMLAWNSNGLGAWRLSTNEDSIEELMSSESRRNNRVLKIAVITVAVIEAIAMVPLILHLANR